MLYIKTTDNINSVLDSNYIINHEDKELVLFDDKLKKLKGKTVDNIYSKELPNLDSCTGYTIKVKYNFGIIDCIIILAILLSWLLI